MPSEVSVSSGLGKLTLRRLDDRRFEEVEISDMAKVLNEGVDFDGVIALDCDSVEFIIIHWDISVFRVLVSAPLVEALDRLARDLVDQLLPQPIAGFLVDLSK